MFKRKNTKKYIALSISLILMLVSTATFAQLGEGSVTGSTTYDLEAPTDVTNLETEAFSQKVVLSWDVAEDNIGVSYYEAYMSSNEVTSENPQFVKAANNVKKTEQLTIAFDGLDNDQAYYFAIKAFDESGNGSLYYSNIVSATPREDLGEIASVAVNPEDILNALHKASQEDDNKSPELVEAELKTQTEIKLTFSESIKLPEDEEEVLKTLTIEEAYSGVEMLIESIKFYIDEEDEDAIEDEKIVVITLKESLELNKEYVISASDTITDIQGNSIEYEKGDQITLKAELDGVEVDTKIEDTEIEDTETEDTETEDTETEDTETEDIETEDTETEDIETVLPPKDIRNLMATVVEGVVKLSWVASDNKLEDITEHVLYTSLGSATKFTQKKTISKNSSKASLTNLTPGKYFAKVTVKGNDGQESSGALTEFTLPETGPAAIMFILSGLGLTGYTIRRKED